MKSKVAVCVEMVNATIPVPLVTVRIGGQFEMLTPNEAKELAATINAIVEQVNAREQCYTTAKPVPVQVSSCNGNVVTTIDDSGKFAHVDISAGGIGLDSHGLRSLSDDLGRVADQIDRLAM